MQRANSVQRLVPRSGSLPGQASSQKGEATIEWPLGLRIKIVPFEVTPGVQRLSLPASRIVLVAYVAAIFVSAALLFAVQPMFTKIVLPRLGGAPSVWSVAMVFFQTMLLLGYAYAHGLTRWIPGWRSVVVHILVMVAAALALPLTIAAGWGLPPPEHEALWLVGLFAASIGLPFFALSANGPLLQAWFARTGHPSAGDPYFLYAASNVGSFLALISYPAAVEPFTRLGAQTQAWSALFWVLIALIMICGVLLARSRVAIASGHAAELVQTPGPTWKQSAQWVALAAIPSGLLVAITAHLSTDVAAVPLMWVVPLALYLASFVIVFQSKPVLRHRWMVLIEPFLIVGLAAVIVLEYSNYLFAIIALNLAAFFVIAMVCHGELARRRPAADHLTAFYLWMSAGGMIGGLSVGLIAPQIFSWIAEYPILIVLAILCRPGLKAPTDWLAAAQWTALLVLLGLIASQEHLPRYELDLNIFRGIVVILLSVSVLVWSHPLRFALLIALTILIGRLYDSDGGTRESIRSFFGVHKITETADGQFRVLLHGTTIHGAQRLTNADGDEIEDRPEPLSYYHSGSPMAQTIKAARERAAGPIRVAVIGLGTGSLACYKEEGDTFHFYEIDRSVVRFSRDEPQFDFVPRCAPDAEIVLGDARLTLAARTGEPYDVIIVDAFSSDAIPVHLLTREAVAVYLSKLAPRGLIALHVSNRHLELASVAAGIARANGLSAMVGSGEPRGEEKDEDEGDGGDNDAGYKFDSTVVTAARSDGDLELLAAMPGWKPIEPDPRQWIWTDDYTNIVGALFRKISD